MNSLIQSGTFVFTPGTRVSLSFFFLYCDWVKTAADGIAQVLFWITRSISSEDSSSTTSTAPDMRSQVSPPTSPLYQTRYIYTHLPDTYLRALDLTAPFTLNNATAAPFTFTPNPSAVPEISSGALWPTNSTLYLAGGVTEPVDTNFPNWTSSADNALWTYQPSEKAWKTPQPTLRFPSGAKIPSSAGSNAAFVESTDTGYLLGGNQDPWLGVGYAGMLAYDFGAQTWENISTPFTQWSSGALVHVPIGQKGILVSLGGTQNNEMFTFSQVEIYNLDTNSWSTRQAATAAVATVAGGGVPVPRKSFCAVLMSALDGKSFQIFVYGGTFNGDFSGEPPQLEDVWVLSMPSFEWFNVYNGTNNTAAAGKREAHSCHAVAGRQMLVYGGRSKPQQNQTCDKTGVFAFDMVDLAWQTEFKPAAGPYQVPDIVAKHLASNS